MPTSLKHPLVYNRETKELISPLGEAFTSSARAYDVAVDKTHLTCVHCFKAAMVHHREGGEEVAGSKRRWIAGDNLPGNRAHFQTAPRSAHADDCIASVFVQDESYDPDLIDHSIGFKIYIGMGRLRRPFNRNNPSLLRRDPSGTFVMTDPDLVYRESISANTPHGLVKLIRSGYIDRVNDSKIVHHDDVIPWNDFFIRKVHRADKSQPEYARWMNLAKNLIKGSDQPAFIHLDLAGKTSREKPGYRPPVMRFCLDTFTMRHPETGHVISVTPLFKVTAPAMFDTFKKDEKEFLVLALPRIYEDNKVRNKWYMDITVSNPKKVMDINLSDVALVAKQRSLARREAEHAPALT